MKKILIVTVIASLGLLPRAWGQIEKPTYRQFFFNPYLFNPAFVGINKQGEVNLTYKKVAANFKGSPVAAGLNLQLPTTNNRVALGFNMVSDRQVLLKNTSFAGTFGYIVPVTRKSSLRFGLSAGLGVNSIDLTAEELSTNDPAILAAASNNSYMDGNFGVAYVSSGLRLGFALTEIFNSDPFNEETFGKVSTTTLRNRLYSVSYRFRLDQMETFTLEPWALYRQTSDRLNDAWEGGAVLYYQDKLWTGTSYHQQRGAGVFFGLNIKDKLTFSYNYEFPPFQSKMAGLSAHELQMSIKFGKKKQPVNR